MINRFLPLLLFSITALLSVGYAQARCCFRGYNSRYTCTRETLPPEDDYVCPALTIRCKPPRHAYGKEFRDRPLHNDMLANFHHGIGPDITSMATVPTSIGM